MMKSTQKHLCRGKLAHVSRFFLFFTLLFPFGLSMQAQTVYSDASANLPPEPIVTDSTQGPNFSTNTADAAFIDIDGDGDQDVYIADGSNNVFGRQNRLLRNDGAANFTDISATNLPPSSNAPLPPGPANSQGVDVGDIDNDGDLDLVVANAGDNEILYNNGNGVFTSVSLPPPPPGPGFPFNNIAVDAELADVDNDGDLDVFFANEIPAIPGIGPAGAQNLLYIQQGNGQFVNETFSRLPVAINISQKIETLDIDEDGDLDFIEANIGQKRILINNGFGFFTDETATRFPADPPTNSTRGVDLDDIDGDGDIDFVWANSNNQPNQVYINNGNGVFTDESSTRLPADIAVSVDAELFDIDYDGDLDLLFANSTLIFIPNAPPAPAPAPNALYLNDGNGVFTAAAPGFFPASVNATFELEIGDLNGDGLDDVFECTANNTDEALFLRSITPPTPFFRDFRLRPKLICVRDNNNGSYTAFFGYRNFLSGPAYVPYGFRNRIINPQGANDGQPSVFLAGGTNAHPSEIFEVGFSFIAIWKLNGWRAIARRWSRPCDCTKMHPEAVASATTPDGSHDVAISVYPNPGTGVVQMTGIQPDDVVTVHNLQGQLMAEQQGQRSMDLGQLANGVYFVRVNGEVVEKWVKQ